MDQPVHPNTVILLVFKYNVKNCNINTALYLPVRHYVKRNSNDCDI